MAKSLALGVVIGATLSAGFNQAVGGARNKFNTLGREIKDLSAQRGLIERVEKDQAALEKARLNLGKAQAEVMRLKLALRKDPQNEGLAKSLADAQGRADRLSASVDKQRQALDRSKAAVRQAGLDVGKMAQEYSRLGKSLDEATAKYERLQARMAKKDAAAARLGELRGQLLGMAGTVYAAGRLIGQAADFETAEVRLSTVLNTDDLPGAMAAARKHALDFARTGLSTETEMLDIQYALNSAGLDASAARAGSEVVAKVAKITSGAAEGVGEVIATTFNNLGASLEGSTEERLERIGELLTKTQFKFQIRDFAQLGESMKYATPALAQFGVELDQGLTLIGALNSAGLQGSMAGTALSATFRQLSKAADEFGFEIVRTADGNMDFIATLENLSDSIGGFEGLDQETIDRLQKTFGEEGQRGVVLLGRRLGELRAAQDDVAQGSKGLIDESYQRFLDSTSGQTTLLTNNLRILGTTFAGTLLPSVNALLAPLAATAKWAGALIERFPWLGRLVGGLAAGFGTFVVGLTAVTAATWLWNAALLANPIGLVVAAVVGAVALIVTFWGPITDFFKGLWTGVKDIFSSAWEGIVAGLGAAWENIKSLFSAGVGFLTKVWEYSPLGLLFKAGEKLAGFVGGLFGDKKEAPQETAPARSGRARRAAATVALGASLAAPAIAADAPHAATQLPPVAESRTQTTTIHSAPQYTINAAPGMNERQLAELVDQRQREHDRALAARQRGALYD